MIIYKRHWRRCDFLSQCLLMEVCLSLQASFVIYVIVIVMLANFPFTVAIV